MQSPDVSVVMSVYNGARHLGESVESVLGQGGVHLEVIIVDDGSTDDSPEILARYASDQRVRLLHQDNQGLTRSLVRGCSEARGEFIARQDADDVSMPGRLAALKEALEGQPTVSLVGCWTRFIGPEGEDLGVWEPASDPEKATLALRCGDVNRIRGLGGHGSAMFRRREYMAVGGYRPEFYFAQDLDLWLRLTDLGSLAIVPRVLYCTRVSPISISGQSRASQIRSAQLILEATRRRERGESEGPVFEQAAAIRPGATPSSGLRRSEEGAGLYFIGRRLLDKRDPRAIRYLRSAALARPWHLRSWISLLLAMCLGLRHATGSAPD